MRKSGILLPVSSLPSRYGIGCFSKEAYEWVDFLKEAGQGFWQILPLGPIGYGDSPYQSFSTFAGNPYFISLEKLISYGWLEDRECEEIKWGTDERYVDYGILYRNRFDLLKKAFVRSRIEENPDFLEFRKKEKEWLEDYALFMALKNEHNGEPWTVWEDTATARRCGRNKKS